MYVGLWIYIWIWCWYTLIIWNCYTVVCVFLWGQELKERMGKGERGNGVRGDSRDWESPRQENTKGPPATFSLYKESEIYWALKGSHTLLSSIFDSPHKHCIFVWRPPHCGIYRCSSRPIDLSEERCMLWKTVINHKDIKTEEKLDQMIIWKHFALLIFVFHSHDKLKCC